MQYLSSSPFIFNKMGTLAFAKKLLTFADY